MWRDDRIVGLVAMHVDAQAALGRELAQQHGRFRALRHRALEVRNAADHVDAHVERAFQVVDSAAGERNTPSCGKATSCRSR